MSEERLKEIKNIFDMADIYGDDFEIARELYNEVVRLRKALNCKIKLCKYLPEDTEIVVLTKEDYERNKSTLEQTTGIAND